MVFASLFNVGGSKSLEVQLSKATDSGVIDVPKDLFKSILEASHEEKSRRVIMMHIRECFTNFAKAKAKAWRRIHAALLLTEELALEGSPDLVAEIASGFHFDLLQNLSFLQNFKLEEDPRAQALVRSKAGSVRRRLVPMLSCPAAIQNKDDLASEDTTSTCSAETLLSYCNCSSDAVVSDEEDSIDDFLKELQGQWLTKKGDKVIVNGPVATWATAQGKFISRGSLAVDGEFLYVSFPNDDEEHHAYLRKEDQVLCWSNGDFWGRNEKGHVNLQHEEWHGVLSPSQNPLQSPGKKVINGLVSVGHSSDTDSESSAGETPSQGHQRGQRRMRTRKERTEKVQAKVESDRPATTSQEPLDLLSLPLDDLLA